MGSNDELRVYPNLARELNPSGPVELASASLTSLMILGFSVLNLFASGLLSESTALSPSSFNEEIYPENFERIW
jgi:hypothetical protein